MRATSTEVQNSFGKYLKTALEQEPVIITRNGKDVARIDPCSGGLRLSESGPEYDVKNKKVSYQEYLDLTANSDDRYELIDGELYLQDSPVYDHQAILSEIHGIFYIWFKGKPCRPLFSPFDVTLYKGLENINVVQPDILVICDLDQIDSKGKYKGVPAMVIEVISPSTRRKDMLKKLDLYLQTGVREYWLVDPDKRAVYLYTFEAGDFKDNRVYIGEGTIQSSCFPGLEVSLPDIFNI
jgi:prevent-host-death family protein